MFHKVLWRQATYARYGGSFNINLATNLQPVICFFKSVPIWQNRGHEFAAHFLARPVHANRVLIGTAVQHACNEVGVVVGGAVLKKKWGTPETRLRQRF